MQTSEPIIRISVRDQRLDLLAGDEVLSSYPISTSRFGLGSAEGSMKTPLGRFRIGEKIGDGVPSNTAFRGRITLAPDAAPPPSDDLVPSRTLWHPGVGAHTANTHTPLIQLRAQHND